MLIAVTFGGEYQQKWKLYISNCLKERHSKHQMPKLGNLLTV